MSGGDGGTLGCLLEAAPRRQALKTAEIKNSVPTVLTYTNRSDILTVPAFVEILSSSASTIYRMF